MICSMTILVRTGVSRINHNEMHVWRFMKPGNWKGLVKYVCTAVGFVDGVNGKRSGEEFGGATTT